MGDLALGIVVGLFIGFIVFGGWAYSDGKKAALEDFTCTSRDIPTGDCLVWERNP